jgi:4-hydroxybenzoate polyprenyltransferase
MRIAPYIALMRLEKPIGTWLLFFPAAWGLLLAPHPVFDALPLLLLGALLTRSAGCILNDMADRRLDAQVARTRTRPLASGAMPLWHAWVLLVVLLLGALWVALQFPPSVLGAALLALPMIAAYPWMKRITWWPQLFLGLTFNLGALMGWLAAGAALAPAPLALYAACMFWTLGYDTIYALQDVEDDRKANIRSTARRLGNHVPRFVDACYGAMLALLVLAGWLASMPTAYYVGLVPVGLHMVWQRRHLKARTRPPGALFRSNQWLGLALTLGLLAARFGGLLPTVHA